MSTSSQVLELRFPVRGTRIDSNHGWPLYGAVSRVVPELHERTDVLLGGIEGATYTGDGRLRLSDESQLVVRAPEDALRMLYRLAGKTLEVAEASLRVGIPKTRMLRPSSELNARIVTIANNPDWYGLEAELRRQLEALGVTCDLEPGRRRVVRIKGFLNIGYAVGLSELSDAHSLLVQARGLGGRRKMGAGFFRHGRLPPGARATARDLELDDDTVADEARP